MRERLTLEQAIARYSGWTIYGSDRGRRWLLAPGEAPEDLSRGVLLIVEGAWVTVWPVVIPPGLGLKPEGRWNPHGR